MILIDREREDFKIRGNVEEVATDLGYIAAEMKEKLMESGMRKRSRRENHRARNRCRV